MKLLTHNKTGEVSFTVTAVNHSTLTLREITPEMQLIIDEGKPMRWVNQRNDDFEDTGYLELKVVPLDEAKAAKLEEINAARKAFEAGGFELGEMHIRTDEKTRSVISAGMQEVRNDPTYTINDWRMQDGSFVDLIAAQITAIYEATLAHVGSAFTTQRIYDEAIATATTSEEVDAITWLP